MRSFKRLPHTGQSSQLFADDGDPLAPQQQPSTDHSLTQTPTHTAPAPTKAAEPEIEGPEIDLGGLIM